MVSPIRTSVSDGVRAITLDRPPGNAIDAEMMTALINVFQVANHDWDTRVVVLDSALPDVFSVGLETDGPPAPPNEPYDSFGVPSTAMAHVRHALRAIWECKWPVIAKVKGTAVGDGLLFAALADVAVVSETAKVGLLGARDGTIGGAGIMRRSLSEQAVRYLVWSARLVEAKDLRALGAGLLIVPEAELDAEVAALAKEIACHDPHLLRHLKSALTEVERGDPLGAHAAEQRYTALVDAKRPSR